jgi:hypothetical protein
MNNYIIWNIRLRLEEASFTSLQKAIDFIKNARNKEELTIKFEYPETEIKGYYFEEF